MSRPRLLHLLALTLLSAAQGISVTNTATLSARGLRVNSNTVELTRVAPCAPRVTPDGSAAQPGRTLDLAAPGSLLIPYLLTQAGDLPGTVTLSAQASGLTGAQVQVQDGAGQPVGALLLAPGEQRTVNVAVLVPGGAAGTLDVNLAAQCGAASDPLNVTRVRVAPQVNLLLSHAVTPARSEVGRTVTFTLRLPNPAPGPLTPTLSVTLPGGLTYRPGSARSGALPVPDAVSADGRRVTFTPGPLAPGDTLTVEYDAVVTPQALPDPGAERTLDVPATATAPHAGQVLRAPDASAHLLVSPGVFDRRATVIGEVFLDANGNGRRDPDDQPLSGARVLLANGQQTLTDPQGRYALRDLTPGPWLLRLDPATAPFEAVPGLGSRLVDVFALTRADFALRLPAAQPAPGGTPGAAPDAPRDTTVRSGPVVVTRRVTAQPGGASLITLELSSARPVADVVVTDRSARDAEPRSFRVTLLTGPVTFSYLTLTPAGPNDPDVLWREP